MGDGTSEVCVVAATVSVPVAETISKVPELVALDNGAPTRYRVLPTCSLRTEVGEATAAPSGQFTAVEHDKTSTNENKPRVSRRVK